MREVKTATSAAPSGSKPITFTVRDLCYLMMAISDNSTTNILIDRVGLFFDDILNREVALYIDESAGAGIGDRQAIR